MNRSDSLITISPKWWKTHKDLLLEMCDPGIRAVIADLNDNGIYTVESCSGHKYSNDPLYKKGVIYIISYFIKNERDIIQILKKHGLRNISKVSDVPNSNLVAYEFDAVGNDESQAYYRIHNYKTPERIDRKSKKVTKPKRKVCKCKK